MDKAAAAARVGKCLSVAARATRYRLKNKDKVNATNRD